MITKDELGEYAKIRNLNLGQAEKDYFQAILLFILYQDYGKELVFKGGTALNKCFGLDRFSEDLDFTCSGRINHKKIEDGLKRFKIEYECSFREYKDGLKVVLQIKGPLFIGIRNSLCRLSIDVSLREAVMLKPEIKTIGRFLEEIPSFEIMVMQEKEILAEKIMAIVTRSKARDVYDAHFLLKRGAEFDVSLANEKLKYYNKKWSADEFKVKVHAKKGIWESELRPLVGNIPGFNEVSEYVIQKVCKDS